MGTTIDHLHATAGRWRHRTSALGLADSNVRRCIEEAGIERHEIDLLVNAGIYRDRNLGEPALAALIQEDVGLNVEDPHDDAHGTFSFDIANGTCGPLTALQVVDGFLRAGTIRHAIVVASDADPGHHTAPGFPFLPAGAAALCSWREGDRGLGSFRWLSVPDGGASFRSVVDFDGHANRLRVDVDPGFDEAAATVAAKVADEVLAGAGLLADDVAVAVVAPGSATFVRAFAEAAGITPDRVVAPAAGIHTAGLLAAFAEARTHGRLGLGATALLVSAGAGITAGACLYRP
ncbi:MAG: 3-oxoacyl-[acyl-carrier-protein] synthase III C-terminal domain-containing protein [Acidimicrobiales bacterium]